MNEDDINKLRNMIEVVKSGKSYINFINSKREFLNPENLYQNSSLLGLYGLAADDSDYFAGLLNSTFGVLPRLLYARGLGNEGNSQLDVYSAKMLPVVASQSAVGKKKVG